MDFDKLGMEGAQLRGHLDDFEVPLSQTWNLAIEEGTPLYFL